MSSPIATRTTRFTPPAAPTRKGPSRRTVSRPGASVVGRADRPVLRIVADDERAPVFTRVGPSTSVEPSSPVEPASWVEPVESLHRIDLDAFFTPEYEGDDQRLEVATPRRSTVRLTHRGRLLVLGLGLAATLGLGFYAASVSAATDHAEQTRVVTVQPGQTLWDLAAGAAHGGDVRAMMSHLETINHLDSTALQAGQHLRIPR